MDRAVGQVAREVRMAGFPKHQGGGKTIYYLSEVELWRHRNIRERTRRRSPAPALEAQGDIELLQVVRVTPAQLRDGGLLPARKVFGDKADTLKPGELDELSRWMSYGVAELLAKAAQELHGTADIRESAPAEYYVGLADHAGDQALCDALNGMAWHWAEQRHPEWSAEQEAQPATKAGPR